MDTEINFSSQDTDTLLQKAEFRCAVPQDADWCDRTLAPNKTLLFFFSAFYASTWIADALSKWSSTNLKCSKVKLCIVLLVLCGGSISALTHSLELSLVPRASKSVMSTLTLSAILGFTPELHLWISDVHIHLCIDWRRSYCKAQTPVLLVITSTQAVCCWSLLVITTVCVIKALKHKTFKRQKYDHLTAATDSNHCNYKLWCNMKRLICQIEAVKCNCLIWHDSNVT